MKKRVPVRRVSERTAAEAARWRSSSCRDAPVATVNDRDQGFGDKIVFEQAKANTLLTAVNGLRCRNFHDSAYAHEHPFAQAQNSLVNLWIAKLGRQPQGQDLLKTQEQLLEVGIVLPSRQLGGFEAIGELLVGHKRLFRFVRSRTDQR